MKGGNMNYLILVLLVYVLIRYIEPIIDSLVVWVQSMIQVNLQYKSLHLQSYAESFDIKEPVIGFNVEDTNEEVTCPGDCNDCPYVDECEYYGEFLDKNTNSVKENKPICRIESTPVCKINRIGFIQD